MLTNPFYKGIVSSPEWGIEVQGKHEALVALEPAERDAYLAEARRVLQEAAPEGSGKEAETLEQQRRNLVTLATDPDNGISAEEFRQERERLNERIDQARFQLRRLTQQREHAEENIAAALEGLVHLDQAYHDMPLKLRREMAVASSLSNTTALLRSWRGVRSLATVRLVLPWVGLSSH